MCCGVVCGVPGFSAAGAQSAARTEQPDHGEEAEHDGDHGACDPRCQAPLDAVDRPRANLDAPRGRCVRTAPASRPSRLSTPSAGPASAPQGTGPPRRPSGGAAPRPAVSTRRERAHGAVGDERPARCERAAAEPREPAHAARHGRDDGERAEVPRADDDGAVRDDPHECEQDRVPAPKDRGPGRGVRLSARAEGGGGGLLRF